MLLPVCIRLIVLGFNRPDVLKDCLLHLLDVSVDRSMPLDIRIDGPRTNEDIPLVYEAYMAAEQFQWPHGPKWVHWSPANQGIAGQWLAAWTPRDRWSEYALIIEDDVRLSPLALPYLFAMTAVYGGDPGLYGIALQRAQWQLGINERGRWRRLDLVDHRHPALFKYPSAGTWGQLLFPGPWAALLSAQQRTSTQARIEGLVTERWAERGRRLISPIVTRWLLATGRSNLFANFGDDRALAISEQPRGVNSKGLVQKGSLVADEEAVRSILNATVATMSPCFDDVARSRGYRLVLAQPSRHVLCCLALFRLHPAAARDEDVLLVHPFEGCFVEDPVAMVSGLDDGRSTIQLTHKGAVLVELKRGTHTISRPVAMHGTALVNADGACARLACPFKPGLYPAF